MIPVGVLACQVSATPTAIQVVSSAQATTSASGHTIAVAYTSAQAGDLIVVEGYRQGGGFMGLNVSASGLTFTEIISSGDGYHTLDVWYAIQPDSTQRTVTVSDTNSGLNTSRIGLIIKVLRNVDNASPIDGTPALVAWSGSTISTTVATSQNNGLAAFAVGTDDDNTLVVSGTGWSATAQNLTTNGAMAFGTCAMPTAGTSATVTFTQTTNATDGGLGAKFAFKAASP